MIRQTTLAAIAPSTKLMSENGKRFSFSRLIFRYDAVCFLYDIAARRSGGQLIFQNKISFLNKIAADVFHDDEVFSASFDHHLGPSAFLS